MASTPLASLFECAYLEKCLRTELRGRVRQLRIEKRGDGIAILGLADSYYSKQLAQAQIMHRSELSIVSNEIIVIRC